MNNFPDVIRAHCSAELLRIQVKDEHKARESRSVRGLDSASRTRLLAMRSVARAAGHHDFAGDISISVDSGGCSGVSTRRFDVFENSVYVSKPLRVLIGEVIAYDYSRAVDIVQIGPASDSLGIIQRLVDPIFQSETVPMSG